MPIYEYVHKEESEKCDPVVEALQKFSDDPLTECPKCGQEVEKILSLPAKGKVAQDRQFVYQDSKGDLVTKQLSSDKKRAAGQMRDHYHSRGENPDDYEFIM